MVLRNSRSIQKHGTGCKLSYCDMREAVCAFAWRSHVTKSCLSWDISDITLCVALMSRCVSLWRHVFTSRPPAIRHIHVKKMWIHWCNTSAIYRLQKRKRLTNQLLSFGQHSHYIWRTQQRTYIKMCWNDEYSKVWIANVNHVYCTRRTVWNRLLYCQCFSNFLLNMTLTLRRLMSYIYGAPILDVSRSHTTTQHSR